MKKGIGVLVIICCSFVLNAQYSLQTYSNEQLDLLKIIEEDEEMLEYYGCGVRKLRTAKVMGNITLGLLGVSVGSIFLLGTLEKSDDTQYFLWLSTAFLSVSIACVTGTIALLKRGSGKRRIRDAFDAARGDLDSDYYSKLEIRPTKYGYGLVYSF